MTEIVTREFDINDMSKIAETAKIGDRFLVPDFTVPETKICGMQFEELQVKGAKAIAVDVISTRAIMMFDHVLFNSALDNKSISNIKKSKLYAYLNNAFREALNKTGFNIVSGSVGLISRYEMFGDVKPFSMFDKEPRHFNYFRAGANRIRFDKNEDCSLWYWLADKDADSSLFASVYDSGDASWTGASNSFGVSPAFVIA